MSARLDEVKDSINNCTFLLEHQKKKVIEILDIEIPDNIEDYWRMLDCVFRKLLDTSTDDLSTNERLMIETAIGDYYGRESIRT